MNRNHACPAIYERQVEVFLAMLHRRWPCMGSGVRILDLGCGSGDMVGILRQHGYQAWGSDLEVQGKGDPSQFLGMDPSTGQIATGDGTFDVVISNQVLEHVMDLPACFQEIRRILRPGGVSLHAFPSRWSLLEQHVNVPFGGVFRSRGYLRLWAVMGIRNCFQGGYRPGQVTDLNFDYLRDHTNYPPRKRLQETILREFQDYAFIEREFLECYAATEGLPTWKRLILRFVTGMHLEGLYRVFRAKVLWLQG